jgi:chemotaxis protein CheD
MGHTLKVGMGDMAVLSGDGMLSCHGLGSCVALAVYDPMAKVAGLAHVMLPTSKSATRAHGIELEPGRYADTALKPLLERMAHLGAKKQACRAKLVGAATMFRFAGKDPQSSIGDRNLQAVLESLGSAGIPVLGQVTGGSVGRSMELYASDGRILVTTALHGAVVL